MAVHDEAPKCAYFSRFSLQCHCSPAMDMGTLEHVRTSIVAFESFQVLLGPSFPMRLLASAGAICRSSFVCSIS